MVSSAHRRQVLLFLVAVALPCTVVVVLGLRIISQERELRERRVIDERRLLTREIRQALLDRLGSVIQEETTRIAAEPESIQSTAYSDPAVALLANLIDGSLVLPWEQASAAERAQLLLTRGPFARSIAEGERAEFAPDGAQAALTAYEQALEIARQPVQQYYSHLLLGRVSAKLGRERDAMRHYRAVLASPSDLTDEFGVTLWSYAAGRVLEDDTAGHDILERVDGQIGSARWLSPAQLYLYRALVDTVAAREADTAASKQARELSLRIHKRINPAENALALKRELASLPISLGPSGRARISWVLWERADWLVGVASYTDGATSLVLAVRVGEIVEPLAASAATDIAKPASLVTDPAEEGELLGAEFPGIKLQFRAPPAGALSGSWNLRFWFYLLAVLLVVSATLFGAYLLWRDVQRELGTARMRSRFVSSVSHELKTPLTAIRILAETLRLRVAKPEKQSQYLDTIVGESERLTRLLNNVLDFTKIERGAKIYSREPHALSEIVRASARAMQYPLEQKQFNLRVSIGDNIPPMDVDRDAIEQAILNLLANAMKYSGENRNIELSLEKVDGEAVIRVVDQGIGIESGEQARIFNQFYRVQRPENQHVPGTGLGLTLVDHIARAHDGYVTVESEPGRGSTFCIHMPLRQGES
jgi:signal transduction histidine kinase